MVWADAGNWTVGQPALTYALRGLTELTVRVRALPAPQHSSLFSGVVPHPLKGLATAFAALTAAPGRGAGVGRADDVRPLSPPQRIAVRRLPFDEAAYAQIAGMVPGVRFVGDAELSAFERTWMQPAIAVIGLDAHPILGSSNQIIAD